MKIVINPNFGAFKLPEELLEFFGADNCYDYDEETRVNPILIEWVEAHEDSRETDLRVVSIPADATDYMINEYDGAESIIYVQDGKLYEVFCKKNRG